jgi:DNA-binding IclR family transcriptional regulator
MPAVSQSLLEAFRLLNLNGGKSVLQIGNELGLSNSDVVCILMPFLRGGLAARRKVTDDWRQDVYYSIYHDMEAPTPQKENEVTKLTAEAAKLRDRLTRLQEDLAAKEENLKEARNLAVIRNLNLGKGRTMAEIQKETGMSPSRILEMMEPLTKSGVVASRYVSQGQYYFYPTKSIRVASPLATEEDLRKLRAEITRLTSEAEEKEETVRRAVKLSVLRTLDLGSGKTAGQIARGTGMSIADVIGMMMTFVRSGLVEQGFTPQGFFYSPPIGTKVLVSAEEERALKIMRREVEEIAERKVMREFAAPKETYVEVEPLTPPEPQGRFQVTIPSEASPVTAPQTLESTRARLDLIEGLLQKMTVRELVLLRERINMELRKR